MRTTTEQGLPEILPVKNTNGRLTRRKMVQRLLAGAGAGTAWPLVATSHPIYELLRNDAILDEAEKRGEAKWQQALLSSQQNEKLVAIAESIVPGSTRAQVSRFIDLLLGVDKPENQHKFMESLTALDAEAQKRFGKSFPALDDKEKHDLLTEASSKPENAKTSETEATKKEPELYRHFENLKGWISGAYYSSQVGMRELGWTGDYVFETFPGCTHRKGYH
jgi:Gluconate 2-dehydrogenase subunit 3